MRKPDFKQFSLEKVKKIKGGGLEVHYEVEETIGQEIFHDKNDRQSTKEPHPDLTGLLSVMNPFVGQILGLTFLREFTKRKEVNASPEQSKFAEKAVQTQLQNISINGISIHGKDANRGCKILAVFTPEPSQAMAINPAVKFARDTYGFEEACEEAVKQLEKECYEYLFEGKKAQLELFDEPKSGKDAAAGKDD